VLYYIRGVHNRSLKRFDTTDIDNRGQIKRSPIVRFDSTDIETAG
jgi:hypothetical protein